VSRPKFGVKPKAANAQEAAADHPSAAPAKTGTDGEWASF